MHGNSLVVLFLLSARTSDSVMAVLFGSDANAAMHSLIFLSAIHVASHISKPALSTI